MQWKTMVPREGARTGVNARNFEPSALGAVRIRLLDGAASWKYVG
jgi:hypothetical protein